MIKALSILLHMLVLGLAFTASHALAQDNYPSSPVRIVFGYLPGSTGDYVARLLAQKLSAEMNVNVFVESKPGAITMSDEQTSAIPPR